MDDKKYFRKEKNKECKKNLKRRIQQILCHYVFHYGNGLVSFLSMPCRKRRIFTGHGSRF
jgi:hypothetical protein